MINLQKFQNSSTHSYKIHTLKQKLNMHVDRHHPEHADKQFFCEFCGKGFIYKATLNHHTTYDCKNFTSAKKVHKKIIEKQWKEKNKSKVSIKCDYCEEVLPRLGFCEKNSQFSHIFSHEKKSDFEKLQLMNDEIYCY